MRFLINTGALVFGVWACGLSQGATVVDFEDWADGTGHQWSVQSHGYQFDGSFTVSRDLASGNATTALHSLSSNAKMVMLNGGAFNITRLDLQEGGGTFNAISVHLWANLPSPGGTVEQIFTLDGRADTYETFYPLGFVNVTQVFFDSYNAPGSTGGFSIDNIVVPEPGTLCLIFIGAPLLRRQS